MFLIIISIIAVLIITTICKNAILDSKKEEQIIQSNNSIEIYNYIKDREFDILENVTTIGKNKKEISNGYYDIKIENKQNYINLYFNKLYKEEYVSKIYVDENYLYEVIEFIDVKYELNFEERIKQELVILIKDKYLDYRNNNVAEKFEKNITQTHKCEIVVDNNMLNVKLYKL